MALHINPNSPLPQIRKDLHLYKGPIDVDGSPTYNIFDPIKAQYYKINWEQSLILQNLRPGITLTELCHEINTETTTKVTPELIKEFFEHALSFDLLDIQKSADQLLKESRRSSMGSLHRIFYRYLYFRIPILRPDAFLKKTLPFVQFLASKTAILIYLILSITGILLLISRFEEYVNTFTYFFNFNGLFVYLLGVIFFKIIHEFAHAYTACYYKLHIPSMGIAFILLIPVLYTDTTDGWKLANRTARIKISAAGLISELILAGLCTLGWALSSPGPLQSMFFVVSSVLWLSSILINMNPAMRYDGYYLLSDWLEIDNLQSRSFTLTRWWIYRIFFGIYLECPEENPSRKRTIFMVTYTIFTWIYRLVLYISLAILLYMFNEKAKMLALLIFVSAIYALLISPIAFEISEIIRIKKKEKTNLKTAITISFLLTLLLLFFIPLPNHLNLNAIGVSTQSQNIYTPENSRIEKIYVKIGDVIEKGKLLIEFSSKDLNADIARLQIQKKIFERNSELLSLKPQDMPLVKEEKNKLESTKTQLQRLYNMQNMLKVYSEVSGDLTYWNSDLKNGQYVNQGMHIGTIEHPTFKVIAFVPENDLPNISENQKVKYISNHSLEKYDGHINHINAVRAEYLKYPVLASINKGNIPVIEDRKISSESKKLKLRESMYVIEISLDNPNANLLFGERGKVEISGPSSSYLNSVVKFVERIFWRESSI